MSKAKPNISLSNLAELSSSGIPIAVRKGINELLHRSKVRVTPLKRAVEKNKYKKILSVIICTANRSDLAVNAVKSVLSQSFDKEKFELLLVNNSKEPFPSSFLPQSVRVVDEAVLGLSRARNRGASEAKGEYLLFMDDDAYADDGLLGAVYSAFEKHPRSAIIGGQIQLRLPTPVPEVFLKGREALWSGYTVPYTAFKEIREQYEFPYGACFAVRHSALDAMGGFPVSYGRTGNDFAGGEETAICFLAKKMGMKIGIEPRARVIHCVSEDRFTKEHIRKTIRAGILTTHRLFLDGYTPVGWTSAYVKERIRIIRAETKKLCGLSLYYKQCELEAFEELFELYFKQN